MKLKSHPALMALTTMIVIGAMALLITVFVLFTGIDLLQQGLNDVGSNETFTGADACAEEALVALRADTEYAGGDITVGDVTCTVTIASDGDGRTVTIDASQGLAYAHDLELIVNIGTNPISVTSWEEAVIGGGGSGGGGGGSVVQSNLLSVDISGIYLTNRDKKLKGITIENTGGSSITIDKITVTWTGGAGTKFKRIDIGGSKAWSGNADSGAELDITNFTLASGAGAYNVDYLQFDNTMAGSNTTIIFTMSDASTLTVSNIQL